MTTDTEREVTPRGWPPEAHVVSASKVVCGIAAVVVASLAGAVVWLALAVSNLSDKVDSLSLALSHYTNGVVDADRND